MLRKFENSKRKIDVNPDFCVVFLNGMSIL